MLSVEGGPDALEAALRAGELRCPACDTALAPWGYARPRVVRRQGLEETVRPRRARCRQCHSTHVLLPSRMLLRRRDDVEVIGAAIAARAAGLGYRAIAARCGVSAYTARRWLRRLAERADALRGDFDALGAEEDRAPEDGAPSSPEAETLVRIERAARARGRADSDVWSFAAVATNGRLLSNTS